MSLENHKNNILVIKLSAIGDFFLAMGAMESICKAHKNSKITLLTTKTFKNMAERSGYFDEVIIDSRPKFYQLMAWIKLFKFFNSGGFLRVYDLQFNDRTKLYYKLFKEKPQWSGVIEGSELYYPNKDWRNMHAFERHKEVLKIANIDVTIPDISWMNSDISRFDIKQPYILLIPGSAPQHLQKRWPILRYAALAKKLIRDGYNIVVLGTDAEQDIISKLILACPEIIDLSGRTNFYDIATLAKDAAGTIGNDTGPVHIAALSACPILVLFCTKISKPELSAPVGKNVKFIYSEDLEDVNLSDVYNNFTPREIKKAINE